MSLSVTISDSVLSVAALLRTGDIRTARAQWRETLTSADAREIGVLAECGRILAAHPRTGVKRLREYWQRADERDRAVIAACAPRPGEQRERPEPQADRAPRWDRPAIEEARRRAGSEVRTEVRPELRRAQRKTREQARAVTEYAATRAGIDDAPQRAERADGYAVDYERLAINPVARDRERRDPRTTAVRDAGRPCVALGCNIEPSRADRAHRDGLCQECRELVRPGIQVPEDATRAQAIEALCAYIHQHYPRPLDHLCTEWSRYSDQADRDTVAAWVAANAAEPAEATAAPELAACQTCGEARSPRDVRHQPADDGQCANCRRLDALWPGQMLAAASVEAQPAPEAVAA